MNETLEQTLSALDEATSAELESSAGETEGTEEVTVAPGGSKGKGKGAQARIQELVAARDAATSQLENALDRHETLQIQIDKLTEALSSREEAFRVVSKIQDLHENRPELRSVIEQLDRAVKGQPLELETVKPAANATETDKAMEAIKATRDELIQRQAELSEQIADGQANQLVAEADRVIDNLLGQLPETYEDKDREVLSRVLEDQVNWEAIEKDPRLLTKEVEKAFQSTVDWYGDPRGALRASKVEDSDTTDKPVKATLDDILGKEWGKLKETGKDRSGRVRHEPIVSDQDFARVMGEAFRKANQ